MPTNEPTKLVRLIRRVQQRAIENARLAATQQDEETSVLLFERARELQIQVEKHISSLKVCLRPWSSFVLDLVESEPMIVDKVESVVWVEFGQVSNAGPSDSRWGGIGVGDDLIPFHRIRGIMTNGGGS